MTRPLSELRISAPDTESATHDLRVTRRTSRSFAAAVAVLLLATVVVNRSGAAFTGSTADSSGVVSSGTIELGDDDQGRSLFDLRDLVPGRPVTRCLEVAYTGTILPVELAVRAEARGSLAQFLDVTIDAGTGGGFESCNGFVPSDAVYRGTLDDLAARSWVEVAEIVNSSERRTFRIEVAVQDRAEALGRETTLELAWEVTPA